MTSLTSSEFFHLLWPEKLLTNETLELRIRRRSDDSIRREFFTSVQEFIDKSLSYAKEWDCYFGVGTRYGYSGKKIDVYRCGAVWADFDHVTIAELKLTPRPDIFVSSGGGVHTYWRLRSQYLVRGERWEPIESVNRGIAQKFRADIGAIDVSRILRVPGTLNHKFSPPRKIEAYTS